MLSLCLVLTAGCASDTDLPPPTRADTLIVADEPRAALIGRDVLWRGGTAVDAAVATALAMTVTLPSRVGPLGGGACLIYDSRPEPDRGFRQIGEIPPESEAPQPTVVDFLPSGATSAADDEVAASAFMRGLLFMQAEYGSRRWQEHLSRAERMARLGVPVSRSLARDLVLAEETIRDSQALTTLFMSADGTPIDEGTVLQRPDLAATLARLRATGVGDLHNGQLAGMVVDGASDAGLRLDAERMRTAAPASRPPIALEFGSDTLLIAPQPPLAGVTQVTGWQTIADDRGARGGASADRLAHLVAAQQTAADPGFAAVSASVVAMSRNMAVACGFTMNGLFGNGEMVRGSGMLLSPARPAGGLSHGGLALLVNAPLTTPLLAASGADAPIALTRPLTEVLLAEQEPAAAMSAPRAQAVPGGFTVLAEPSAVRALPGNPTPVEPIESLGRGALIHCLWDRGEERHCRGVADERGFGLAVAIEG